MIFLKKILDNQILKLPSRINLSNIWNIGFLLGFTLTLQILTGILVSFHYWRRSNIAFERVNIILIEVDYSWLFRSLHANGASLFFLLIYLHVGRGLYYSSFKFKILWISGIVIIFVLIATAFIGYVLPWGQIRYWGATVIINIFSAIPFLGKVIVQWVWGDYSVRNITLNRFYSFHFLFPFILFVLIIFHLIFLHFKGSRNPIGFSRKSYKIIFHPFLTLKDALLLVFLFFSFIFFCIIFPNLLIDSENFLRANLLSTPEHIKPEWYYLFAYAILRALPRKLGGVIALVFRILILGFLIKNKNKIFGKRFLKKRDKFLFWVLIFVFFILTWLGAQLVEHPFVILSQLFTIIYFIIFLLF